MNKSVLAGWKLSQFHLPSIFIQRKKTLFWALTIFLGTSIYCYHMRKSQSIKVPPKRITTESYLEIEDFRIKETQDFLINTPGCFIPNYAKQFSYDYSIPVKTSLSSRCGKRAVFIDTIGNNNVQIRIEKGELMKYNQEFICCYKFVIQSIDPEEESDFLTYTPCKVFLNNVTVALDHEIIMVKCYEKKNKSRRLRKIFYEDSYVKIKKMNKDNTLKSDNNTKWNILMIGIQGMSRTRVFDTMPLTARYLQYHNWLDYKGYQKIDQQDTFSYLWSILTGMKISTIESKCKSGLFKCADFFIWKKYKDAGYHTAYGEDYLQLPDVFSTYNGFKGRPTDHYMRPFFLTGEKRLGRTNIVCTNKKPSATHLLEYAHNFVNSYKNNNTFGLFWIKSYTNGILNDPSLLDAEIVDFFKNLKNTEVFNTTFVIFFSDQGTSYGKMRIPMESYYDERLPMLFVWTPFEFRRQYVDEYYNLKFNEGQLITPHDLYVTLEDVLRKSINLNNATQCTRSEACPQCTSLFDKKSPNRTCADVGVSEIWCSCHNMSVAETDDKLLDQRLKLVSKHITTKLKYVKTVPCMTCRALHLFSIKRAHQYHNGNQTYDVIAFTMVPGRLVFEAVVENFEVLHVSSISGYNTRGNCALNPNDRPYCVCTRNRTCTKQRKTKIAVSVTTERMHSSKILLLTEKN